MLNPLNRLRITQRLALGFGLLLAVFLAYGLYAIDHMTTLANQTIKFHQHPFTVKSAVLQTEIEFIKIHRAMKDVALSTEEEEIFEFIRRAQEYENIVHRNFEIIRRHFLGERSIVEDAFQAFLDWAPIRTEVIGLQLRGDREAAAAITQGKGAKHVALLESKIQALQSFAEQKADEFLLQAEEIRENSIRVTQVLLLGILLLVGTIAFATSRSIKRPLLVLTEGAELIAKGQFDHRVSVSSMDELGTLAGAFNAMVENITKQTETIQRQNDENERLLLNILPAPIADRIKLGEGTIAESYASVTVLFTDLCGFTELANRWSATELVGMLNQIFSEFDELAERYGVEKIKTIGDAYMAVAGLPKRRDDHASAIARVALEMLEVIRKFNEQNQIQLNLRIGINSGPVVAGVIGKNKFIYDLWGDTVNIASRMESHGIPGEIQISRQTYEQLRLEGGFEMESRGEIDIKGRGSMKTYLLKRK